MKNISLEKKHLIFSYAMLAPIFLMVAGLALYPVVYAFVLSFTDRDLFDTSINFVGLTNFIWLFKSEEFWNTLVNTLIYAGSCAALQVVAGLATSLLLVKKFRGNYYFRAVLTFPYLVPTIVAVLVFQWMLNDVFGIVNRVGVALDLLDQGVGWFDTKRAMFSVILVSTWRFFPFAIMLFVPALEAIPEEFYEAAKVDGASPVQRFFHITLPQMKEVLFVVIVLRGIWMFNMFDVIWLLTGGGPVGKTQILPILAYLQALQEFDIGLGSATATMGLVVLVIFISIYFKYGKK
jgi:multiple sugar transport system permease protein